MADQEDPTQALLDSRRAVYGDRIDNMVRTAQIWSGLLGVEIQPVQVPVMMAAYKQLRMMMAPDYSDNIDDSDGWMKMAREILGEDLIQARTVEEYVAEKQRRLRDPEKDAARRPVLTIVETENPYAGIEDKQHRDKSQAQWEGEQLDRWIASRHQAQSKEQLENVADFLRWLTSTHNVTLAYTKRGSSLSDQLEWLSNAEAEKYVEEYRALRSAGS